MPRRTLPLALMAAAFLLAGAVPAGASFHREQINEVMLSNGGDTSSQFVELKDANLGGEPFPAETGPYELVLYDAAGTRVDDQALDRTKLAAAGDGPFLVSTAAADQDFSVTGDDTLGLTLPAAGGQICFTHGATETPVSCVAWGCSTTQAHAQDEKFPAPADGKSLQRTSSGGSQFVVADPTPKADNATTGASPGSCTTPPPAATNGNDKLTGTSKADRICGKLGDDVIKGLGGGDTLFGDNCPAASKSVFAAAADGDDRLDGGDGADTLNGGGARTR